MVRPGSVACPDVTFPQKTCFAPIRETKWKTAFLEKKKAAKRR